MQEEKGHLHPLTVIGRKVAGIFVDMGFALPTGPELETEYYNFDALNIPANHPARDMWDTFWLKPREEGKLLRTHTSPVQVHYMEKHKPPFAICSIGRAYRYEATDMTHENNFNQIEGLMVGKDISLANLKGILEEFFRRLFKKEIKVRFRPSYFPFVEPGLEVDMACFSCDGRGSTLMSSKDYKVGGKMGLYHGRKYCSVCKGGGWIEIMG
ncbi:MAG: phenylalanine--tRNA ligase subunit alpha, partial [Patescibacteria group bacterium]